MCRNDKKLLKYELMLDLFSTVVESDSYIEDSSVGRVFVNLAKMATPMRWKRLLDDNASKPPNMGVWWELWEKHEKELEKLHPDIDDEDDDQDDAVITSKTGDSGPFDLLTESVEEMEDGGISHSFD